MVTQNMEFFVKYNQIRMCKKSITFWKVIKGQTKVILGHQKSNLVNMWTPQGKFSRTSYVACGSTLVCTSFSEGRKGHFEVSKDQCLKA